MNNTEYIEYLKTEKWKRIARKRLEIDNFKCCMCGCEGTTKNPLETHHLSYKYLGHEEDRIYEDLVTLCHACHKQLHRAMNRITNADGRRGWKSRADIPKVHSYNLCGDIETETERS